VLTRPRPMRGWRSPRWIGRAGVVICTVPGNCAVRAECSEEQMIWSMGVLFLPYSAWGHVSPMLAVVAELTGRGVPVRMVAGSAYRSAIEAVGAEAVVPAVEHEVRVPPGWRPMELIERSGIWRRRRIAWTATRYAVTAELRRDRPDVCVVDPHVPWGSRLVSRYGVPVVPLWTTHARTAQSGGPVLVNALPELQPGRSRFGPGVHFVGPLVGAVLPGDRDVSWLSGSDRTLVVATGTVFARPAEFFRNIVDAFTGTGWTVILATARLPVEHLGVLPRNVHAHRWIPQSMALERASVFLTHAGMNSVHEAVLAGVPMISAPHSREQRLTAARLRELGVAVPLGHWSELVGQAARMTSDPLVHQSSQRMKSRAAAAGGAVSAADLLLEIADRR